MKVTDEAILGALLATGSNRAAAKALGVTEKTIRNRLQKADFRERYEDLKNGMVEAVADEIAANLSGAVQTIVEVMTNPENNASVRSQAAGELLRTALKYFEAGKFERRITALEAAQHQPITERWNNEAGT